MVRRLLACALAFGCAGLVLAGCSSGGGRYYRFTSANRLGTVIAPHDRKPAKPATGKDLDGRTIPLDRRGKVTVVNYWATWCPPCVQETPEFDRIYRQDKAKGVAFVGVATKQISPQQVRTFVRDHHISYPMVYDEEARTALELGDIDPPGLPYSVIFDRRGRVAAVYTEPVLRPAELEPVLDRLAAER